VKSDEISDRELKLTAPLYLKVGGKKLLEHVKATGHIPDDFVPRPHFHIPMNLIIQERGTDITLSPDEQLVYNAILKENKLPGGSVRLVDEWLSKNNHS
jgi:hypothetical protein